VCSSYFVSSDTSLTPLLALTNVVNQLLDSGKNSSITNQAVQNVHTKDPSSLAAYVLEALSTHIILVDLPLLTSNPGIDPPFTGVYRIAKQDDTVASLTIKQGERLFLDVAAANMNVSRNCARLCTSLIRDI
jgi:linoleate 10R-lipoxygenase